MDMTMKALLQLVKSAMTGKEQPLPKDVSLEAIYELALKHQIAPMAYDGAIRCGYTKQEVCVLNLFQHYCRAMIKSENQIKRLNDLYAAFDAAQIDYMPLKGCNMKALYPTPELRTMNDADILIRVEQYDKIKSILEELGYSFVAESDCELKWVIKGLYLELHKRLIPSFIKDFYAYFGDGWQLAQPKQGTCYAMSKEDEFLFLFTHFARHYREGGVGIRHMADIWYYRLKNPDLDEKKVVSVLKQMSLDVFYANILKTLENWFEDGKQTDATKRITRYVGNSGSFGNEESKTVAEGVRAGGKKKSAWGMIFPPLNSMRYAYPVLKKCPVLLPVVWVYRWFKVLFFERKKIKYRTGRIKNLEKEKLEAFEKEMRAVGIQVRFEEK